MDKRETSECEKNFSKKICSNQYQNRDYIAADIVVKGDDRINFL